MAPVLFFLLVPLYRVRSSSCTVLPSGSLYRDNIVWAETKM